MRSNYRYTDCTCLFEGGWEVLGVFVFGFVFIAAGLVLAERYCIWDAEKRSKKDSYIKRKK